MAIDNSIITIQRIPELVISSGIDWLALAGHIVTIAVVFITTAATVRNFRTTIASQENVAAQNNQTLKDIALENNRALIRISEVTAFKNSQQLWLNEIRSAVSRYCAAALNVRRLNILRRTSEADWGVLQSEEPVEYSRVWQAWCDEHVSAIKEVEYLLSNIRMLLNPADTRSGVVIDIAVAVRNVCDVDLPEKASETLYECDQLILACQTFIQLEQDRPFAFKLADSAVGDDN